MGIYDRDYYREKPGYLDSLIPAGTVCKWLIGINIAVFIAQLMTRTTVPPGLEHLGGILHPNSEGPITEWLWLKPSLVLSGEVWRLLTYAFLHSPNDLMHIFFNMLFLWWFGSDLELIYGPREFLTFYLLAAFAGGVAYLGWYLSRGVDAPCLGASGAVTALLVLCACHFPHRTIYVMLMLPVPLWLFALFNVAQDSYRLWSHQEMGIAVAVHLAGAGFAFAYYKMQWRVYPFFAGFWTKLPRRRSRPRLRLYRPEDADAREETVPVAATPPGEAGAVDEHLEAKLDAVLEKLTRSGKESLTESERQILMRASEIYKRRRT
jgi:membrane associated rhomboid family serine protease